VVAPELRVLALARLNVARNFGKISRLLDSIVYSLDRGSSFVLWGRRSQHDQLEG
jgi:hypothetical protein